MVAGAALAICLLAPALPALAKANNQPAVVATVGDHKITQQELDERIRPELNTLSNRIYEIKRQAVESMADQYLLEQAALKEHLTFEEYLKRHVTPAKVTDADAKKFYDENKARIKQPFDKIKGRIIALLEHQHDSEQRAALIARLKKATPVKVMIEPPRFDVATAGHPSIGPKNAPVTIVEFADFQCPFCGRVEPTLEKVRKAFGKKVRLVYMNFPLGVHAHAFQAAEAALCAEEQGKFWPYHDRLFANQSKLDAKDLKALAAKTGLQKKKFEACLDKSKYRVAIEQEVREGQKLGVTGTPSFFINGRLLVGAQPFDTFKSLIDEELARKADGNKSARAN